MVHAAVRFRKGTESNPYRSMLSVSCIYYVVCFCGNTFLVSEQGSAAGFHHYGICSCGSGRVYFDPLPGFHKREIRQADVNRNQAITLENRVKIRYVNTKNAVDFICEKYHVRNAKELEFLYGQYQEEAREKETFRKTSDDLDYYTQNLLQYLTRLRMYDTRVWLTHANALVDSREMVELKHELLTRRQKLRARMEYSVGSIHEMKGEALKNMSKLGNNAYQLEQIIRKIEAMNPVFK